MLWFTQVVFRWRTFGSCVWLIIVSTPALHVLKVMLELMSWSQVHVLPSLMETLFIILYIGSLVLLMLLYSETYSVKLPVFQTRLAYILSVLQPQQLLVIAAFLWLGALASYCLSVLVGYGGLTTTCSKQTSQSCVNESGMFIVAYGSLLGLHYGVLYFLNKSYFMAFPSIQQNLSFRIRGHVAKHLKNGLSSALKVLQLHYLLFYFTGGWLQRMTSKFAAAHPAESSHLTTLTGLLDLPLLLHLLSIGVMVHFTWSFGLHLFQTYHTQALKFPVVALFAGDSSRLLTTALKSNIKLLKALGFLDLYQLSLHCPQRRREVFSLSVREQPEVWECVCSQCLAQVTTITRALSDLVQAGVGGQGSGGPGDQQLLTNLPPAPASSKKGWTSPSTQLYLSSPGVTRRYAQSEGARLWSSYSPGHPLETDLSKYSPPSPKPTPSSTLYIKLRNMITSIPRNMAEKLRKKPFFIYFLDKLPSADGQDVCVDCQQAVWAIIAISELAVASYQEDVYGVVQRSLPDIVDSLIDVSRVLDKLVKAPLSNSRSTEAARIALELNGRYAIKTAVQTSLCRLALTFSHDSRSIPLTPANSDFWDKFCCL